MEVHHHAHTARKKWTHYFWEFLMLFLAVFCGFLAEYKLEHMIEHQREKKFARLMLADMRADSTFFTKRSKSIDSITQKHKELLQLMTDPVKATDKELIVSCHAVTFIYDLQTTTATYYQMKTSGSLRYIQNEELTKELLQYYEVLLPRVQKGTDVASNFFNEHLIPYQLKYFRVQDYDFNGDSLVVANPVILNRTSQSDQELLNIYITYGSLNQSIVLSLYSPATKKLNELIVLLQKEYHLN